MAGNAKCTRILQKNMKKFDSSFPGNMWSQSWKNVLDLTIPYPGRRFVDVTQTMQQIGFNPTRIFRTAEDFFVSLGLQPMPRDFYFKSMLQKPLNRDVICHASAWDFCDGVDYR